MPSRVARREYYHEHHVEGHVFRAEQIQFRRPLAFHNYGALVCYTDPSWKDTKSSDYKACVLLGAARSRLDVLRIWCRQANTLAMVQTLYDWWEEVPEARYYIEAGMNQDLLVRPAFEQEADRRGRHMPIRYDTKPKQNKVARIENIEPYFKSGLIAFDKSLQKTKDFETFKDQLLGFPFGHDDGPDALQGAIKYAQQASRSSAFKPRTGAYRRASIRD